MGSHCAFRAAPSWNPDRTERVGAAGAGGEEALHLAKEIDDRQFMANVLACMSLQATYQDKPADSLALVTAAQDQARSDHGTTPRVRSMLSMREAFARATLGNRDATHRAIGEAHHHFERISLSDPDPSWVTSFDEPKLIVDTSPTRHVTPLHRPWSPRRRWRPRGWPVTSGSSTSNCPHTGRNP
ncbi:hypothetical protein SUDANB96_03297 [Streptomyces sp. enrichment culture]